MPEYKILAVGQQVRDYSTAHGDMRSYKLKLEGVEEVVELSQKASTPAPQPNTVLNGTIDLTGSYGPKFKKEYNQGGFGGGFSGGTGGGSKSFGGAKKQDDPFTMYLSYAKDLAVALVETSGYDAEKYNELLKATLSGGKALYNGRPGASTSTEPAPAATPDKINLNDIESSWNGADAPVQEPLNMDDIPF